MAFDVYVGPLSRYYLGDWENVAERAAREIGVPYEVVRPADSTDEAIVTDPDQVRAAVCDWRESLTEILGERLEEPFEWREDPAGPYITDRPEWLGYGALLLLAAYEEHPEHDPPARMPERWQDDPVLALSRGEDLPHTDYAAILLPELWLPSPFDFLFKFVDLAGHEMFIGSLLSLRPQLENLNEHTFKGSPDDWRRWAKGGPPPADAPFADHGRFALGMFLELATRALEHGAPMKLDY